MDRIDHATLLDTFEKLDDALQSQQTFCVIDAAAILFYGHTVRQTEDIDIWRAASEINDRDLGTASRSIGVSMNPKGETPEGIYLQTIAPGIVQLPAFHEGKWATGDKSEEVWRGRKLTIVVPPPAIIIAAKLVRGEEKDIDDCLFVMEAKRVTIEQVKAAVRFIPDVRAREQANENIIYLELTDPEFGRQRPNNDKGPER